MDEGQLRRRLAANLKTLRWKQGFTQEKLAELIDVSTQTIAFIEGGRTWTSDKTIVKLAAALNAEVSQFFIPNLSEIITDDSSQRQSISEMKTELLTYFDTRFMYLISEMKADLITYIDARFSGVEASRITPSRGR